MKKLTFIFIAVLIAWSTSAQTTFTVPERTPEQQYPRLVWIVDYNINVTISYAKSQGQTVEEFGKYCGDLYKQTWPKEGGFQTFVTGNLMNLTDLSKKVEIANQTDEMVTLKVTGLYQNLRDNESIYNVSYDEYIRFLQASHQQIAEYMGCSISFKILDNTVEVVLESTPDKEYVVSEAYKLFNELNQALTSGERQVTPDNQGIGFLCSKMEKKKEAEEHFSGAILNANRQIEANIYPEINLPYLTLASVCSAKGEKEKALEALAKNKSYHLQTVFLLKQDPLLDNIRNEPKFQEILKETERKYENARKEVEKILAAH